MAKAPSEKQVSAPDETGRNVVVSMDANGVITVDGEPVALADLSARLKQVVAALTSEAAAPKPAAGPSPRSAAAAASAHEPDEEQSA